MVEWTVKQVDKGNAAYMCLIGEYMHYLVSTAVIYGKW